MPLSSSRYLLLVSSKSTKMFSRSSKLGLNLSLFRIFTCLLWSPAKLSWISWRRLRKDVDTPTTCQRMSLILQRDVFHCQEIPSILILRVMYGILFFPRPSSSTLHSMFIASLIHILSCGMYSVSREYSSPSRRSLLLNPVHSGSFHQAQTLPVYFDRTDVKKAIHAPTNVAWLECSNASVFVNGDQSEWPVFTVLPEVIEKNKRTVIVHGLADFILMAEGWALYIFFNPATWD